MTPLIDFHSGLMPYMRNGSPSIPESHRALRFLHDQFGFSRFYLSPLFDCTEDSVAMFLLKRQRAMERLFAEGELPGTIQLRQGATVLLRASLWETKDLQKLALKRSGHLPLQFPLGAYQEWMDTELNCLLYKGKFPLLFTSFEIPVLLYPKEIIEKLLRIRDAAFQFNYRALSEPTTRNLLRRLLKQGSPVLLGTGVNNTEQARYYELTYALKCAENELTPSEFQALLEWNQSFWKC